MSDLHGLGWALASRPVGMPKPENFQRVPVSANAPQEGEVQVRNLWLSVDPYMRGRMMDVKSYVPPFQIGEVMQGGAIGRVVTSGHTGFRAGDLVQSMAGWREVFTAKPDVAMIQKLPDLPIPEQAYLGVAGMPGLTAYAGLLRIGEPKEGDTVFVSGAAGAVGSIVCQIARIKGCTVVGSAGGPDKVAILKDEIGVDAAIDYKAAGDVRGLMKALREAAPNGIDVYFDNVGGDHLTAALDSANDFARLVECGMISGYNAEAPVPGPPNIVNMVRKRLKMQGFIVFDHQDLAPEFQKDMADWIGSGRITWKETVQEGIDATPDAFMGLFTGDNTGKMLVKLDGNG